VSALSFNLATIAFN